MIWQTCTLPLPLFVFVLTLGQILRKLHSSSEEANQSLGSREESLV